MRLKRHDWAWRCRNRAPHLFRPQCEPHRRPIISLTIGSLASSRPRALAVPGVNSASAPPASAARVRAATSPSSRGQNRRALQLRNRQRCVTLYAVETAHRSGSLRVIRSATRGASVINCCHAARGSAVSSPLTVGCQIEYLAEHNAETILVLVQPFTPAASSQRLLQARGVGEISFAGRGRC
jgi:hypothetical protein